MKKASVYTRTGDLGITGLVGGTRIKKNDARIDLYGEVDELNAFIGLATTHLSKSQDLLFLHRIQSALFDLGCNLACEKEKRQQYKLPIIKETLILDIENEIDKLDSNLPNLSTFILPGGSIAAAQFHVCRTVCRRVERKLIYFLEQSPEEVPDFALKFINRLSDYFFILSRYLNAEAGVAEISWKP